jgi:hypothetical protein
VLDARSDQLTVVWPPGNDGQPQRFDECMGDIYVDGSAVHPLHPHIASAACAAVQLRPDGSVARRAQAVAPLGWPQTAAAAERLAAKAS